MPSTAIRSYRYDPAERKLQVRFLSAPDRAYVYLDVTQAYFLGLERARAKDLPQSRDQAALSLLAAGRCARSGVVIM